MLKKRYVVLAFGIVSVLLVSLFVGNVILAQSGGEYDPWMDLNADGVIDVIDLQLLAFIYGTSGTPINKTTRYYSIPASAWLPSRDYYVLHREQLCIYTTTAGTTVWFAPINLPDGAVVTELRAWIWDNDFRNVSVYLHRQSGGSFYTMASAESEGASTGYREFATTSITPSTVDNQNYAYHLSGYLSSGNSNHRFGNVRITYTLTETLP